MVESASSWYRWANAPMACKAGRLCVGIDHAVQYIHCRTSITTIDPWSWKPIGGQPMGLTNQRGDHPAVLNEPLVCWTSLQQLMRSSSKLKRPKLFLPEVGNPKCGDQYRNDYSLTAIFRTGEGCSSVGRSRQHPKSPHVLFRPSSKNAERQQTRPP